MSMPARLRWRVVRTASFRAGRVAQRRGDQFDCPARQAVEGGEDRFAESRPCSTMAGWIANMVVGGRWENCSHNRNVSINGTSCMLSRPAASSSMTCSAL